MKKNPAERSPRAVGGAEICILNGLRFITVGPGEVLAIRAINKEPSLAIDATTIVTDLPILLVSFCPFDFVHVGKQCDRLTRRMLRTCYRRCKGHR